MARGLQVAPHLGTEELKQRYQAASDPVGRTHFQVVYLAQLGRRSAGIAEASGYSVSLKYARSSIATTKDERFSSNRS